MCEMVGVEATFPSLTRVLRFSCHIVGAVGADGESLIKVHRETLSGGFSEPLLDDAKGERLEWLTKARHTQCVYGLLMRLEPASAASAPPATAAALPSPSPLAVPAAPAVSIAAASAPSAAAGVSGGAAAAGGDSKSGSGSGCLVLGCECRANASGAACRCSGHSHR